jgi:methoxymalonate biosynthesis acyl carrier protein
MNPDSETIRKAAREAVTEIAHKIVADDECVVSTGLVDSLSVVKLIVFLEEKLGIRIPRHLVQPEDFDSVEIILDTVERVSR